MAAGEKESGVGNILWCWFKSFLFPPQAFFQPLQSPGLQFSLDLILQKLFLQQFFFLYSHSCFLRLHPITCCINTVPQETGKLVMGSVFRLVFSVTIICNNVIALSLSSLIFLLICLLWWLSCHISVNVFLISQFPFGSFQ